MAILSDTTVITGEQWISSHDETLRKVIDSQQSCTVRPHGEHYKELVEAIIGQQLSVKAAASITNRFNAYFGGTPSPKELIGSEPEILRGLGLSYAKIAYMKDLAAHIQSKAIRFEKFPEMKNEEIMSELLPVKGIGEWTVHMFLLFCMGRSDVLATGDLGVRKSIQQTYGLPKLPTPTEVAELASKNQWHPYESIACWHLWRLLDNKPAGSARSGI